MTSYLLRNVATGVVLGPYSEKEVPRVLWGQPRGEWTIFKSLQGDAQSVVNRLCKRRYRQAQTEE